MTAAEVLVTAVIELVEEDPPREDDPIWRVHLEDQLNATVDVQAPVESTEDEIRVLVTDSVQGIIDRQV